MTFKYTYAHKFFLPTETQVQTTKYAYSVLYMR